MIFVLRGLQATDIRNPALRTGAWTDEPQKCLPTNTPTHQSQHFHHATLSTPKIKVLTGRKEMDLALTKDFSASSSSLHGF